MPILTTFDITNMNEIKRGYKHRKLTFSKGGRVIIYDEIYLLVHFSQKKRNILKKKMKEMLSTLRGEKRTKDNGS